jgi:hypothetical protein
VELVSLRDSLRASLAAGNWYPRVTLVRGGRIFITTRHNGQCRFFDPASGDLVGPALPAPPSPYHAGWDYSVVLLPLVPGDGYRARVLAVNGAQLRQPLADTPPRRRSGRGRCARRPAG